MLLKNKVILITGSTTGIGAAAARACIAQGAQVMLHGRDEKRAKELSVELGNNTGYVIAELDNMQSYQKIIDATVDRFGQLDGLVNNAGIFPRNTIDSATEASYETIMSVNLKAPLFITQAAVKVFRQHKIGGSIVNIGSINAYCGQNDLLIYSISKGALMTMTRNLSDALGREHIRVNQLNVGWTPTETEIALKKSEGLPADWQERIPLTYAPTGKLQTPESVAQHVVFWLSDASAPTSGAIYEVEQYPVIGRNRITDITI